MRKIQQCPSSAFLPPGVSHFFRCNIAFNMMYITIKQIQESQTNTFRRICAISCSIVACKEYLNRQRIIVPTRTLWRDIFSLYTMATIKMCSVVGWAEICNCGAARMSRYLSQKATRPSSIYCLKELFLRDRKCSTGRSLHREEWFCEVTKIVEWWGLWRNEDCEDIKIVRWRDLWHIVMVMYWRKLWSGESCRVKRDVLWWRLWSGEGYVVMRVVKK